MTILDASTLPKAFARVQAAAKQKHALGELIRRATGFVCNEDRPGATPQGIAEAALEFARACGWTPPADGV